MAKARSKTRRLMAESLERRQMFAAGDLDPTFNGTGFNIISQLSPNDEFSTTMGIFPTAPGYIVLAGYQLDDDRDFFKADSGDTELVFVRPDTGTLNTNIGTLGSIVTRVGLADSRIAGIAFQEIAGTLYIVTAGYTEVSGDDLLFAATDIDPENPYTIASISRDFTAEDVGSTIEILEDTTSGWLAGSYTINAVDANGQALLNQAPANPFDPNNVLTGGTWALNDVPDALRPSTDILVSRYVYNPSGDSVTLDTSFAINGHAIIPVGKGVNNFDYAYAVEVDALNRIVVAGYSQNADGNFDFAVTRLVPNGTLDQTFFYAEQEGGPAANRGRVMIDIDDDDYANALAVTPSGEIFVAGSSNGSTNPLQTIVKLDQFGVPSASFDGPDGEGNGIVTLSRGDAGNGFINSIKIYPADAGALAGSIITAGTNTGTNRNTVLSRLNGGSGVYDTSFGSDGVLQMDLATQADDWGNGVILQPAGAGLYGIVITGSYETAAEGYNMYVARLTSNGGEDNTFFDGDFIHVLGEIQDDGTGENDDYGATVLLDSTNRIVVGGSSLFGDAPTDFDFTVLRFVGTPVVAQARVSGVNQAVVEHDTGVVTMTVELVLDKKATGPVTVTYATQNGTAIAGADFVARTGTVTFGTGVTKRPVTIQLLGNTDYQANRNFSLVITGATGAQIGAAASITIRDNDGSWQNVVTPEDVDGDDNVHPSDVLMLIDDINRNGIRQLVQATSTPSLFADVNGDTLVSPADVLAVIDRVNRTAFFSSGAQSALQASGVAGSIETSDASTSTADATSADLVMVGYCPVGPFEAGSSAKTTGSDGGIVYAKPAAASAPATDAAIMDWDQESIGPTSGEADSESDLDDVYNLIAAG